MPRIRAMIGMPVVCGGRRLGRLIQAELSGDLKRLDGIWVSAGWRGSRYIPAEDIEVLGRVAVVVDDRGRRGHVHATPLFYRAVSTDGARLGAITGAWIDAMSFAVTALELSRGLWSDLFGARSPIARYTASRETGVVVVEDPAGQDREVERDEARHDEGPDRGNADRRFGGDDLRRRELADGAQVEPAGPADGQLGRWQS